jgi:PAS domain S-box-containing protein
MRVNPVVAIPSPSECLWLDDLSTAVLVTDEHLKLLAINSAAEVLLGLSRERVVGGQLGHWLRLDRNLSSQLQQVLRLDQPATLRGRALRPLRGAEFLADLVISPLRDEGSPGRLLLELTRSTASSGSPTRISSYSSRPSRVPSRGAWPTRSRIRSADCAARRSSWRAR